MLLCLGWDEAHSTGVNNLQFPVQVKDFLIRGLIEGQIVSARNAVLELDILYELEKLVVKACVSSNNNNKKVDSSMSAKGSHEVVPLFCNQMFYRKPNWMDEQPCLLRPKEGKCGKVVSTVSSIWLRHGTHKSFQLWKLCCGSVVAIPDHVNLFFLMKTSKLLKWIQWFKRKQFRKMFHPSQKEKPKTWFCQFFCLFLVGKGKFSGTYHTSDKTYAKLHNSFPHQIKWQTEAS